MCGLGRTQGTWLRVYIGITRSKRFPRKSQRHIMVEGKVSESFGPTLGECLSEASPGKKHLGREFPRAKDWGSGLTVCIAAICLGNSIITISDQMLSVSEFSADNLTVKFEFLHRRWIALISGGNISDCQLIMRRLAGLLDNQQEYTLDEIIAASRRAYLDHLRSVAEAQVLGVYGISVKEFIESRPKFGNREFERISAKLEGVTSDAQLLMCGFDQTSQPHIFCIQDAGNVLLCDKPGFWAIGAGANSALSSLFFREQKVIDDITDTFYNCCEAKFMAESAPGVGKQTFIWLLTPQGSRPVPNEDVIQQLRKLWKEQSAQPASYRELLENLLE